MPLTTAPVTGYLTKPDGTVLRGGRIVFTLSGMASADNHIVNAQENVAIPDAYGLFSIDLMPNESYEYPTYYSVIGYESESYSGRSATGYDFGKIRVPSAGGDIQDMLPVPVRSTTNVGRIVKGDTLIWVAVSVDDIGHAVNLTGADVECNFIHTGGATETATVDMTSAATGRMVIEADTTDWLAGFYSVRLVIDNQGIKKTQIGKLEVIQ